MAAAGTAEFWKHWEGRPVGDGLTLQHCLGGGANSAVFLTTLPDGANAAIRLVRANPSTAELQLARWQKAGKLSHPNLIRLLNSGRCQLDDAAMLYVVMEYAEEDLSQVLPDRALTSGEAREMLGPALNALRYVHRQGFIHGRIKPSNIMAIGDQVKLSGDGLCRAGEINERRAAPGRYDPPEIVTGGLSPASDVWSLGMTLTEVLTQRLPEWRGAGQQSLVLPEGLAEPFPEIIRHCLQTDAKSRWSVEQVAAVLQGGSASSVRPAESFASPKPSPPWRFIVPVAALVILAGLYLWSRGPSTPDAAKPPEPAKAAVTQTAPPVQTQTAEPSAAPPAPAKPKKEAEAAPTQAAITQVPPASGEIMVQVMPKIAQHSLDAVHGRFAVVIRAKVDAAGNVSEAGYEVRGSSKFFAEHTLAAAKQWHFQPSGGPQEWLLRFEYSKGSMTVVPTKSEK